MPRINAKTIIYGRFFDKDSVELIPNITIKKVIMGTSKASPKAKNIFIAKFKKLLISVAISIPCGAILVKKLNTSGKNNKISK